MNGLWGRGDMRKGCWWGNLREGDHLEDIVVDRKTILKWILRK
jgi:hypothetical protein